MGCSMRWTAGKTLLVTRVSYSFIRVGRSHWYFASPGVDIRSMSNNTKLISYSLFPSVQFSLKKKKKHRFFGGRLGERIRNVWFILGSFLKKSWDPFYSRDSGSISWLKPGNWLILFLWFMLVLCSLDPEFFGFYRLSMNLVAILSTFRNTVIS